MTTLAYLVIHFCVTLAKLMGPGGARAAFAETLLVKHQLLVLQRQSKRTRAPNLTTL